MAMPASHAHLGRPLEVYHGLNPPLEYQVPERELAHCYNKLIVHVPDEERVLGLHFLGPNAGEVMQGFALAFIFNARKADLDALVGIHPTAAEVPHPSLLSSPFLLPHTPPFPRPLRKCPPSKCLAERSSNPRVAEVCPLLQCWDSVVLCSLPVQVKQACLKS